MPSVYIETYGCQMNVADTELMRGHLARSGYTAASDPGRGRRHPAQHLRHPRARRGAHLRPPRRPGAAQAAQPHLQIGLAGCMAQHFRDRLLTRPPRLRRRSRRLPAAARAARAAIPFVDVRLDRDETYADLAPAARRRRARVDHDHARLRQVLHLLHRALRARPRAQPAGGGGARPGARRGGAGLPRGRLPRPDGERLPRRRHRLRRPAARRRRDRRHRAHPLHLAASERHDATRRSRRWRRARKVCPQLHLPLQSGSDAGARAHGSAATPPTSTCGWSSACAPRFPAWR